MRDAFGGPFRLIDDTQLPADRRPDPLAYTAWVKEQLSSLKHGDPAILRLRRPRPTAAFSPQDTAHPDYATVRDKARDFGFEPVERGTGGRLTMFDEGALAITLISAHREPHRYMMQRYELLAGSIAAALAKLGIAAQVGELPNEYCPGKFSVNAEGRVKLVGVAQRMNNRCFQMGAIISVERSDRACIGIANAYAGMGLDFDPATYGAITDLRPSLTYSDVCDAFADSVGSLVKG